jgi:hypothetical protein
VRLTSSFAPVMTPWRAWLLAALLLLSQAAGLAHRIAHATPAGGATAQAVWKADHLPGSADCRLVDQLTHADALCSGMSAAAPLLPPADTALALAAEAVWARTGPQHPHAGRPGLDHRGPGRVAAPGSAPPVPTRAGPAGALRKP